MLSYGLCFLLKEEIFFIALFVVSSCTFGAFFSYWLARYYSCPIVLSSHLDISYVFSKDDGTAEMRAVSDPIKEGAEGFLRVQYSAIFKMAFILAGIILLSYSLRPASQSSTAGVERIGSVLLGILSSLSFAIGAGCSAATGYVSMWVSASCNIRVCSAARRGYPECMEICFRGGAFSAVLCITLCVFGVSMLYFILSVLFVNSGVLKSSGKILPT
jgi:H+-translocating diphosphatase